MDNTPIIDVGDEPDTSGIDPQEEAFYEATGEDKEGYTKRHLAKLEDSPDLAVQIQTETRKRELLTAYIEANMKEGMDFYKLTIQGRESKPSLSKSGSEKFLSLFALQARFKKDDQTWEMLGRPAGVICYVCELYAKHGTLVGEGRGARAVDKDRDVNKAIKMAAKSAQIDAILRTGALSDYFTQDLENEPQDPLVTPAVASPAAQGAMNPPQQYQTQHPAPTIRLYGQF